MKQGLKQIALIFLVLAIFMATSLFLFACGSSKNPDPTTGGRITVPGAKTTDASSTTSPSSSTTASTASASTTTPIVIPDGKYINPLTGLPTNYDASGKRPVAIVVDNIPNAYAHQTGLNQADILYEALVAPGITRFMMLISDYSSMSPVCNVRSARIYHMDLAMSHNAVLVAHNGETWNNFVSLAAQRLGGGWSDTYKKNLFGYVNTKEEYAFGTKEGGARYGTIKYYTASYSGRVDLKYDTLVTASALQATFNSKTSLFNLAGGTANGNAFNSFKFVPYGTVKTLTGASASNISLRFTMDNYSGSKDVNYAYNASTGKYLRYQDGDVHKDSVTGEQLSCTNLVVLFTDVTNNKSGLAEDPNVASMITTGSGSGYYFHGGKSVEIRWTKTTWNSQLTLTTTDGTELTLACGNTHVAYLDNTNPASVLSFN